MELVNYTEKKYVQLALLKERGLDKYLDSDLSKFQEKFDRLCKLLNEPANDQNFNEAFQIFYIILDAVPLLINNIHNIPIFRAQTNKANELFYSQTRISYNKTQAHNIQPGKFNAWYEPMFYGSVPYKPKNKSDYFPPSLTACLETCKELYNPNKTILIQDFTIGRWKQIQPITFVNLCFDQLHLSYNTELEPANRAYIDDMRSSLSNSAFEFVKNLFEYYSVLCRTGSNEGTYYILTALFTAIRMYYQRECNIEISGIVSPSAATEGKGLNIVMTPESVDKYLILDAVMMERFFLILPEANNYSVYPCSELIENHYNAIDFNYSFCKYIRPADRFLERLRKLQ